MAFEGTNIFVKISVRWNLIIIEIYQTFAVDIVLILFLNEYYFKIRSKNKTKIFLIIYIKI